MKRFQLIVSILLFAGVLGAAIWLYMESQKPAGKSGMSWILEKNVDLAMRGQVKIHEVYHDGMSIEISGDKLDYTKKGESVSIGEPKIHIISKDSGDMSFQAKTGLYYLKIPAFEIKGDVRGSSTDGYEIETESLLYELETRVVSTDAPVKIKGGDVSLAGTGMKYFIDRQTLEMSSDVKALVKNIHR